MSAASRRRPPVTPVGAVDARDDAAGGLEPAHGGGSGAGPGRDRLEPGHQRAGGRAGLGEAVRRRGAAAGDRRERRLALAADGDEIGLQPVAADGGEPHRHPALSHRGSSSR